MFELLALAFQADLTRVATMMIGRESSIRSYDHLGLPEHRFDGSWIGIVSITGDPLRDTTGDSTCGAKKGFCRCLVPLLTE